MTILLVEQNLPAALEIATRGYVIETGEMKMQGRAEALQPPGEVGRTAPWKSQVERHFQ